MSLPNSNPSSIIRIRGGVKLDPTNELDVKVTNTASEKIPVEADVTLDTLNEVLLNSDVRQSDPTLLNCRVTQPTNSALKCETITTSGTINVVDEVNLNSDVRQNNQNLLNATVHQANDVTVVQGDPLSLNATVVQQNPVEVVQTDGTNLQADVVVQDGALSFIPDPYLEIHEGNYPDYNYHQLYARSENITSTSDWSTLLPDGSQYLVPLIPAPSTTLAISGSNSLNLTTQIVITGFADNTTTTETSVTVTLAGNSKVLVPGTWYRIRNIQVSPLSPTPLLGLVWIYDQSLNPNAVGVPPDYYDFLRISPGDTGQSFSFANARETGIYYCPPNKVAYANSWTATFGNNGSDIGAVGFRLISPTGISYFRQFRIGSGGSIRYDRPQIIVPTGWTVMLMGIEISGTTSGCNMVMELIERTIS